MQHFSEVGAVWILGPVPEDDATDRAVKLLCPALARRPVIEPEMAKPFPEKCSRCVVEIVNQPVTLTQNGIDIMLAAFVPAGRQAGADHADADGPTGLEQGIAPRVETGETCGLFGKVCECMAQGTQTVVQGFGVDWCGVDFGIGWKCRCRVPHYPLR